MPSWLLSNPFESFIVLLLHAIEWRYISSTSHWVKHEMILIKMKGKLDYFKALWFRLLATHQHSTSGIETLENIKDFIKVEKKSGKLDVHAKFFFRYCCVQAICLNLRLNIFTVVFIWVLLYLLVFQCSHRKFPICKRTKFFFPLKHESNAFWKPINSSSRCFSPASLSSCAGCCFFVDFVEESFNMQKQQKNIKNIK